MPNRGERSLSATPQNRDRKGADPATINPIDVAQPSPCAPISTSAFRKPLILAILFAAAAPAADNPCASCHSEIAASYARTPMAQSSGPVGGGFVRESFERATFHHAASGFDYRVKSYAVEFGKPDGSLHGAKSLRYFIGSGVTARSYILVDDGYFYEAPVAYYTAARKWDLAPRYEQYGYPYVTRPILPGCLGCHASGLRLQAGTQNRYQSPPFDEGGVSCARCHGDGETHIARMKGGNLRGGSGIVNPARLDSERRDSICAQCHLSGEARVMRPGATWNSFRPGDRLSDTVTVFVSAENAPGMTVTGHVEKLAQSACKRAAGDRLWCGTCHDPHRPADFAAIKRQCLSCHPAFPSRRAGALDRKGALDTSCKETVSARSRKQDDCVACHMPRQPVTDAQHVVYIDHSIPRRPRPSTSPASNPELTRFGGGSASARDLAMAYAITGQARAVPLLEAAARDFPNDTEVLLYLAEAHRAAGKSGLAAPIYERALQLDPSQLTGLVGLGSVLMERGQYAQAIRLWEDALRRNAGLMLVRTNLAMAYLQTGDRQSAETHLKRALEISPGFAAAADLLRKLR